MKFNTIYLLLLSSILFAFSFSNRQETSENERQNITLKDTIGNFVFDSLKHNFGEIDPYNYPSQIEKHFKYIGDSLLIITRAWTGDPHFICSYPKEPLEKNKIYSFRICFHHRGRQGILNKKMGFNFSDGTRVSMLFKGNYKPFTNK